MIMIVWMVLTTSIVFLVEDMDLVNLTKEKTGGGIDGVTDFVGLPSTVEKAFYSAQKVGRHGHNSRVFIIITPFYITATVIAIIVQVEVLLRWRLQYSVSQLFVVRDL